MAARPASDDDALLTPRLLAALDDLRLVARRVAEGVLYGAHPSRTPGAGLEFSQYRTYQPGDDLRRVDWKLYARSDRFYVREAEVETSIPVRLVLDASASMGHADAEGLTKLRVGAMLAAALAVVAERQGDGVGLSVLAGASPVHVPPRYGEAHLPRVLHALHRVRASGRWPGWGAVEPHLGAGRSRGLVGVVTDLHEHDEEIKTVLGRLAALGHEVVVFHLIHPRELTLDYGAGVVTFEELETGRTVQADARRLAPAYRAAVAAHTDRLRRALADAGVTYARLRTNAPLPDALRLFLRQRARLR